MSSREAVKRSRKASAKAAQSSSSQELQDELDEFDDAWDEDEFESYWYNQASSDDENLNVEHYDEDDEFGGTLNSLKLNKISIKSSSGRRNKGDSSSTQSSAAASRNVSPKKESPNGLFGNHDYSKNLVLRPDHQVRPIWIDPSNARIIVEQHSLLAPSVNEFLTTIAEPMSRPSHMHEFRLTHYSLYAAVSVGLQTKDILTALRRFCKTILPESIVDFIENCTVSFGKVKLVLKHSRYFLESNDLNILKTLLRDEVIGDLRIESDGAASSGTNNNAIFGGQIKSESLLNQVVDKPQPVSFASRTIPENTNNTSAVAAAEAALALPEPDLEDQEGDEEEQVHSFEISGSSVETAKRRCNEINYPLLEEYDFRNDERNPTLDFDLKPSTQIRPYQEKALSKMFGNGRARSGIIVLPCGAGKTLVGVTAACTIKKSVIVLCTSSVSVMQWRQQFRQWTTIRSENISVFTSDLKQKFEGQSGVVCSTYSMIANTRNRSYDSQKIMDFITSREWGFLILDEVHVVPAAMFRRVVTTIKAHAKLGLTATLVREDNKINDLNFLIGPKLYEANWMDLAQQGHIANVQCAEVWCPMTPEFFNEYLRESAKKRMLLYIMNPKKFQACQFLIDYHEKRGDKIIVFSDNVYALTAYALKLKKYYIYGGTPQQERMRILENFQYNDMVNTIFLSKVGDMSIDLPEATCLIQISSHYGSRRQEAQRLGRILRAKKRNDEGFNAFFYSLVSKDTQEMYYSTKRQAFLIDQGYAFKVITYLKGMDDLPNLAYSTKSEQLELLQEVLLQRETASELDDDESMVMRNTARTSFSNKGPSAKRSIASLSSLGGADKMAYIEYNKSANKQLKKDMKDQHHALFRKLYSKH